MEQIDFGSYVHTRMNQTKGGISKRVLAALPPAEVRVEENHTDELITNAALLIRKELQPQLEEAVEALGQSMGDEYSFKLEGPWPPFSFVDRVELHLSHA
jgi:DNA-binding IclR family transcriptional regulator